MKVPTWLALLTSTLIPAIAASQQYQVSSVQHAPAAGYGQPVSALSQPAYAPQPQPTYAPQPQPSFAPQPQPGYAPQPAFAPAPVAPATYPSAPNIGVAHSLGDQGMQYSIGGGCDSGGCSGYGMGGGGCDAGGCSANIGGDMMLGADYGGGFGGGGYADGGFDGGISGGGCGGIAGGLAGIGGCRGGGTYFTAIGGGIEMDRQRSTAIGRDLSIDFNQGWAIGGAIGRRVGRNLRSEIEYVFRNQTPEVIGFNGNAVGNIRGFQNSHAAMLNFAYDLVFGNGRIVPYVGGGVGVASIDSRVQYGPGVAALDGDDASVAYQWMAGISFRARPNMEMFVEYRFFEIDDPKLNRFGGPAVGAAANPNVLLDSEYQSNDVMGGIRFNF